MSNGGKPNRLSWMTLISTHTLLAQLAEHFADFEKVIGSIPMESTAREERKSFRSYITEREGVDKPTSVYIHNEASKWLDILPRLLLNEKAI